jgi:spore maturation protein CgeB
LPRFYNACAVNLNATSLQMGSAVNQRVFDVPACESFVLTDYQDSLAELFEPGEECVAYREAGEIADLTRHYLKEPAAARTIARRGRERVLKQHTYKHRLQSIIRHMTQTYGNTL